jgi:regulator of protease activity HflC (stomatin/prohibitin superfamily)
MASAIKDEPCDSRDPTQTSQGGMDLSAFRVDPDIAGTLHLGVEVGMDSPIFTVGNCSSDFSSMLRPPNATDGDMANTVKIINSSENWAPLHSSPFGKLVPVGSIRLMEYNGRVYAVGPGRWILKQSLKMSGRLRWLGDNINLAATNQVQMKTLTISRVAPGQIGLAFENMTQAVLLAPGLHVYNCPSFKLQGTVDVQQNYFQHGAFHVLRVQRGRYALVWESPTQPRLLREGNYAINSPTFKFESFKDVSETYIKHGTIHIVQVPKGQVGKVTESITPKLLAEGVHVVDHPNFKFDGLVLLTTAVIKHGTITRFRVNMGDVGLATWHNEAIFIDTPGTYEVDSPDFIYLKAEPQTTRLLVNGNKKVVTVFSGEVGLSYRGGCLDVLQPGRHMISKADHYFDSFMSTQQVTLRLKDLKATGQDATDLIVAETKDFVKVGIKADLFFSIADAYKTVVRVGKDGVQELLLETAIGTLTNIIRSTCLNEIAQSETASVKSKDAANQNAQAAQALGQPSAPLFFDRAHDEFLARLHDDFLERYGIEISNIRVESFKIMDKDLSASISSQAITTAQTENKLANLKGQTEIATAERQREAQVAQIAAEQQARALKVTTESQNQSRLEQAQADAEAKAFQVKQENDAKIAQARAEAEAIRLRAEAEAEAIRTKAEAEAKRAALLSGTPLGAQLALLEVWTDTIKKSNEGISKVVYCDPAVQQAAGAGNPLGLLGLGAMQGELQRLSAIGEATSMPGAIPRKK